MMEGVFVLRGRDAPLFFYAYIFMLQDIQLDKSQTLENGLYIQQLQ